MFSFHKPRVYRSTEGCCICRAKSSSSRFTDSKKYESDSMKCFNLKQPRYGEICNACVLLVKRYKRLPVGSNRHWGHVVDARAGPGTKSLTKYKKHRDDADSAALSLPHHQAQGSNSKSIIPEKFSKIFKKNKKSNKNIPTSSAASVGKKDNVTSNSTNSKRKSPFISTHNQSWDNTHQPQSLPSTPDSIDSDYEDNCITSPLSAVVQFQTETRASSYRSRNVTHINSNSTLLGGHKKTSIVRTIGSKRRKCLTPRKYNRAILIENFQFFDEVEWQEIKSCCGIVYECPALGNTLLLDLEQFKPCTDHEMKDKNLIEKQQPQVKLLQKTNIAAMPAVVQLATAHTTPTTNIKPVNSNVNINPTPVLKKHHLFFKRQSECFPHGDINLVNINKNNNNQMTTITTLSTKTDSQVSTENRMTAAASVKIEATDMTPPATAAPPINVNMQSTQSAITTSISSYSQQPDIGLMPKHSMAKITTISPASSSIVAPALCNNIKSNSFLHKIKSDTSKIVKHSLEKINTAVRLKPGDIHDMRHLIKTVDKSCLLAKPHHTHQGTAAVSQQQHHTNNNNISIVNPSQTIFTTTSLSSSSSATKFSDNSSDSGFDENLQDRKSASPLQEDTDKKIVTRPGVQTMFLASGVQIQGQQQNLILTGNEVTAKISQNRKQHIATGLHQHNNNQRSFNSTAQTTTAVKIAQIVGSGVSQKMRAIYNNTIQHENGVTTIVPASSFTASSQTAAMSALAPSTVTITPSPMLASTIGNINGKKLSNTTTTGHCVIGINSTVPGSAIAVNSNNISGMPLSQHQNNVSSISNNVSNLNQKIILVKTAKYNSNNNKVPTVTATTATIASNNTHHNQNTTTVLNHLNHHSICKN